MTTSRQSTGPVGAAEFAHALGALTPAPRLAVAFSGGPDSLALLFLAARWARARKRVRLIALTVDHGLRPGSASEARLAARMAAALGVPHRILKWKGEKPKSGIQAAARAARYRLLAEACRKEGVGDLLVAHHLDDQAETFLLRLARGSGVDGLAAMAPSRWLEVVPPLGTPLRLLRPLLDFPRARLAATLEKAGLEAIHDPSNENERFDRVKARRLLGELGTLGLDAHRLADTAAHMARVRTALEADTRAFLAAHARMAAEGFIAIAPESFGLAADEIALRALAEILKAVSGSDYPPRFEALRTLFDALKAEKLGHGRTLHGCKLSLDRGLVVAVREPAAALAAPATELRRGQERAWDGRFVVKLAAGPAGAIRLGALGAEGLARLKKTGLPMPEAPRAALLALPALWKEGTLLGAPHIGFPGKGVRAEARLLKGRLLESP